MHANDSHTCAAITPYKFAHSINPMASCVLVPASPNVCTCVHASVGKHHDVVWAVIDPFNQHLQMITCVMMWGTTMLSGYRGSIMLWYWRGLIP